MAKKNIQAKSTAGRAIKGGAKKSVLRRRRRSNNEMSGITPLLVMLIIGLAVFKVQLAILFGVGMLPTFVMGFTSKGEYKSSKLQCVAFTNLMGVLYKFNLVLEKPHLVSDVLLDPITILVMWGAAVIGHVLIYLGPWGAAYVLQIMADDKLKKLNSQRQELIELWGQDVMGNKEGK